MPACAESSWSVLKSTTVQPPSSQEGEVDDALDQRPVVVAQRHRRLAAAASRRVRRRRARRSGWASAAATASMAAASFLRRGAEDARLHGGDVAMRVARRAQRCGGEHGVDECAEARPGRPSSGRAAPRRSRPSGVTGPRSAARAVAVRTTQARPARRAATAASRAALPGDEPSQVRARPARGCASLPSSSSWRMPKRGCGVEVERARIPPDDVVPRRGRVAAGLHAVDRRSASSAGRSSTRVAAERRAARRRRATAPAPPARVERAVQQLDPAGVEALVADRRHDQQIAGARRGDVGDAQPFGLVALRLVRLVLAQLGRRPAGEAQRAQAARRVDAAARRRRSGRR